MMYVTPLSYSDLFRANGRKKGNVLFNDTLNSFYLQLYGTRYMVKDHSETGETHSYFHGIKAAILCQ